MENINTNSKQKKTIYILLVSIILLQCFSIIYVFAFLKEGYHTDEVWNYAFANSYNSKELTNTNDGQSLMNRWNSSDLFKEYLSVDKDHRFSYDGVFRNVSMDLNPPFQYLILHTICSFFPGVFSWWFCFAINIVAFFITQVFLFKYILLLTENKVLAIAGIVLYGFSMGAVDIAIFMRIYALAVLFIMIFLYFSQKIYNDSKKGDIKPINYIILFISCFLGGYTLYLFLISAFFITLCYSLYFLFSRKWKIGLLHGFTCLISAVLSILSFSNTFLGNASNIGNPSYAPVKYPFGMQLRYYMYMLTRDLFGIHISAFPNPYLEWFLIGLGCVVFLVTPFIFVFRKDVWFIKLINNLKEWIIKIVHKFKNFQFGLIPILITSIILILIASQNTSVYGMQSYSTRYIFIIYPLVSVFCLCFFYYIFFLVLLNKTKAGLIILPLAFGFALWSQLVDNSDAYLFLRNKEGITAENFENNANCILVITADWYINSFAPEMTNINSYYATNFYKFKEEDNIFDGVDLSNPCYIIVSKSRIFSDDISYEQIKKDPFYGKVADTMYHEKDFLDCFNQYPFVKKIEYVGTDKKMTGSFLYYRVYFEQGN